MMNVISRNLLITVLVSGISAAARADNPPPGAPRENVNFGIAIQYDDGRSPMVALADDGTTIEVHQSQSHNSIWYRVGKATVFDVQWSSKGATQYDNGRRPSVAFAPGGKVVEVHLTDNITRTGLFYRVGKVEGDTIAWGDSHQYDDGDDPFVAINSRGQVVEVHKSQKNSGIYYHVGTFQGDRIAWGPSHQFDDGLNPKVALNNQGQVLEVHRSEKVGHTGLFYHVGTIQGEKINFGSSSQYDDGNMPSVALADDGMAVEVHQSQNHPTLWQRSGRLQANGTVAWNAATQFDDGASATVAINASRLAVQVHEAQTRSGLWYSPCLITDRSRWMELVPGLASKSLWQVTMPGTHDSGAYDMSTDRCPCRDLKFNIKGTNIMGEVTRPFSEAQAVNFDGQLRGGVRYFDLRPYDDGKSFHAYHDVIGADVAKALDEMRAYLDSVRREIVILDVSHFCGIGGNQAKFDHNRFRALLNEKLGPYLLKSDKSSGTDLLGMKVGNIVAQGPRVIVYYEDPSANNMENQGFYTNPKIYNNYADVGDSGVMIADQTKKMMANAPSPTGSEPSQMFLLSWTVTLTSAHDFTTYPTLHNASAYANYQLGTFARKYKDSYKMSILYVDFFADARVTDIAMEMNR